LQLDLHVGTALAGLGVLALHRRPQTAAVLDQHARADLVAEYLHGTRGSARFGAFAKARGPYPQGGGESMARVGRARGAKMRLNAAIPASDRETAMVAPSKFAHVVYNTHRYEDMIAWYQRVFEARVQHRDDTRAFRTYD